MKKKSIIMAGLGATIVLMSASPASAQYRDDPYSYCRDRAADISGYNGRSPDRHRGGVIGDAIRGSIRGRVVRGVTGGNRRERNRAARDGARIGVIAGAIRRGVQRDRDRRARREYRRELDDCMSRY